MKNDLDVSIKFNRDIATRDDVVTVFNIFMNKVLEELDKKESN